MKSKNKLSKKSNLSFLESLKSKSYCYIMMAPFMILFFVFTVIPVLSAVVLSFTDFNLLQKPDFVGFSNYFRLFLNDDIFMVSLKNTFLFAIIIGPVGYILSFVIAWFINELGASARSFITLIMYAPALVGNAFVIWAYIFSSDSRGLLNTALEQLGIIRTPILWTTNVKYNFTVCVIVSLWMSFGTGFLSFVASFKTLERSYFEAAAIDGLSNRWQELAYVTFPQMGPQLLFGAVMSISNAFAVGSIPATLTGNPSTNYSTHTLVLHISDYGTTRFEMGYASAIAVVLFALMILSLKLINSLLRKYNA